MEGNLRIRIKFEKTGRMQYLGHLDELRVFEQALRRTEIDVARTDGYTPRMILSFASPLGIGKTSLGEYVDVDLWSLRPSGEILAMLNEQLPEGYRALTARKIPWYRAAKAMCASAYASYDVRIPVPEGTDPEELVRRCLAEKELICIKPDADNKRMRRVDIRPGIHGLSCTGRTPEGEAVLSMFLAAASADTVRPELVLHVLTELAGDPGLFGPQIGTGKMRFPGVQITRTEIYAQAREERMELVGAFSAEDVIRTPDGADRIVPLWALGDVF